MPEPLIQVIEERVKNLEKAFEDFRVTHRESKKVIHDKIAILEKTTNDKHDELDTKVDNLATAHGRVEIMFSNLVETITELKKDVRGLADDAKKDKGWREVLLDVIKAIVYIGGVVAAMKWFT
jgi:hypothetical protein